jgi:hypothetical protein
MDRALVIIALVILASCQPLAPYVPTRTPAAAATITPTVSAETATPLPYWQLAILRPGRQLNPADVTGGKMNYSGDNP